MSHPQLEKSIGLVTGIAYCVTIIIGAGVLALPGAAYQLAGTNAVLSWLFDLLLAIPLIYIFSRLIGRVQSAGGIADFVRYAFGDAVLYKFSQVLLIITLFAGTAAIALVGAEYLGAALNLEAPGRTLLAFFLLAAPTLLNSVGLKVGSQVQKLWAAALLVFLLAVILSSLRFWDSSRLIAPATGNWGQVWQAMGLIWFAYTGVEMISFLGEEFSSPRKFILAIVISFFVVGIIYLGLAIALSQTTSPTDARAVTSPIVAILERTMGARVAWLGGLLGFVLIWINLNGSMMGASRLIYAVAREGIFLPRSLAHLNAAKAPARALITLGLGSMLTVGLLHVFGWSTQPIFLLVSQNWFLLYVLSILAFLKVETSKVGRSIGMLALVVSFAFMRVFSWFLLLPAVLLLGLWGTRWLFRKDLEHVGSGS
ncbi:APC family permease [Archangium violaceum]|uniref:APC family permease n=1 Tax=Archangium violaceum TaxID=83451 RepID=UPI0036D8EEDC